MTASDKSAAENTAASWQLRHASAADLDGIMALETSIFTTDAWSERSMRTEVSGEHGYYLVAFRPETPDAVEAYAGLLAPVGAVSGDIQTLAVAPAARRHGLGRTLVLCLLAEARKRGAREVFLEVRADNPGARNLYHALGFEEIGVRARYYQPDGVDAVVMRTTLAEPVAELAVAELASVTELASVIERAEVPRPSAGSGTDGPGTGAP